MSSSTSDRFPSTKPYYAYDEMGAKAVAGKVKSVTLMISGPDVVTSAEDLPEKVWPFQINNVAEWYRRIVFWLSRRRDLVDHFKACKSFEAALHFGYIEFLINDGAGIKTGKGRQEVRFTFKPMDLETQSFALYELVLVIRTRQYSSERYYKRKEQQAQGTPHGFELIGDSWYANSSDGMVKLPVPKAEVLAAGLTPGKENV